MNDTAPRVFTGRTRRKETPWNVRMGDFVAKWSITIGGIGTVVAVSLVFLFLFAVVVPLFLPASVDHVQQHSLARADKKALAYGIDEFRTSYWTVDSRGELRVLRLDTGKPLTEKKLLDEGQPTVIAQALASSKVAVGLADGSIRFGDIGFATSLVSSGESLPEELQRLKSGERLIHEQSVVEKTSQGQWRMQQFKSELGAPVSLAKSPLVKLDFVSSGGGSGMGGQEIYVAFFAQDGQCQICRMEEQENQFTGETTLTSRSYDLKYREPPGFELVRILITSRGDNVLLVWTNGLCQRFDIRNLDRITLVEEVNLLPREGSRVTDCGFVLGRETLVVGDTSGGLRAWFRSRHGGDVAGDGQRLTLVHDLTVGSQAVRVLQASERSRMIAAGYDDGLVRIFQVTTDKLSLEHQVADGAPIQQVAIAPKEDGLIAATPNQLWSASLDPRHPEATFASLFRPVWYEGYDQPQHIWQSSYATSAPEPKLGLFPLVFGTIKATFYTMLFAAPLSLLAAVYTSEFMHPRTRSLIKPSIEMMASLPSVVLGFLAALVFAPVIETHVTAVIATLFLTPFIYLLAAHLWQAIPQRLLRRWEPYRLIALVIPLPLGVGTGLLAAPLMERWLFAGDVMRWLDRQIGSGIGAWLLLWLPMSGLLTMLIVATQVNPWIRPYVERCTRSQYVVLSLAKFLLGSLFAVALAGGISWLLDAGGWDPRGSYVSTYVQRNALIVGAVMGFAVIPIIYTIADDALNTVPQHLRSASLGCGATPWQTAIRVVVPTAMSGLFSALMIGLGRAVGETMIVLMAGGNTPVLEWNVFSGFRTLSANIATELPEAVRDSTHYRTLFLAALTLFLMTFCVNTVAEVVRLRFRKRAFQL